MENHTTNRGTAARVLAAFPKRFQILPFAHPVPLTSRRAGIDSKAFRTWNYICPRAGILCGIASPPARAGASGTAIFLCDADRSVFAFVEKLIRMSLPATNQRRPGCNPLNRQRAATQPRPPGPRPTSQRRSRWGSQGPTADQAARVLTNAEGEPILPVRAPPRPCRSLSKLRPSGPYLSPLHCQIVSNRAAISARIAIDRVRNWRRRSDRIRMPGDRRSCRQPGTGKALYRP